MLVYGGAMMLFPETMISLWPWKLSVFTSQAIGAWGVGIGVIAMQAMMENDWDRALPLMPSYAVLGGLQLINLLRYPTIIDWSGVSSSLYTALLVSILFIGVYGSWKAVLHRKRKLL